jgi:hypothetical protein
MGSEVGEVCFYHLDCPFCGEYFISIPALTSLEVNPDQEKKRVLSGMAFEAHFYRNKPLQITPELIEEAKDISLHEKLFKLTAYFHGKAKESNADLPQNPACCYLGNDKQYSNLMKTLKSYGIIGYIPTEDDDEDCTSHFAAIEMTTSRLIKLESLV